MSSDENKNVEVGEEGDNEEKEETGNLPFFIIWGILIGSLLGFLLKNLALGVTCGILIGVVFGVKKDK